MSVKKGVSQFLHASYSQFGTKFREIIIRIKEDTLHASIVSGNSVDITVADHGTVFGGKMVAFHQGNQCVGRGLQRKTVGTDHGVIKILPEVFAYELIDSALMAVRVKIMVITLLMQPAKTVLKTFIGRIFMRLGVGNVRNTNRRLFSGIF